AHRGPRHRTDRHRDARPRRRPAPRRTDTGTGVPRRCAAAGRRRASRPGPAERPRAGRRAVRRARRAGPARRRRPPRPHRCARRDGPAHDPRAAAAARPGRPLARRPPAGPRPGAVVSTHLAVATTTRVLGSLLERSVTDAGVSSLLDSPPYFTAQAPDQVEN